MSEDTNNEKPSHPVPQAPHTFEELHLIPRELTEDEQAIAVEQIEELLKNEGLDPMKD